jgi:hypothetical protein
MFHAMFADVSGLNLSVPITSAALGAVILLFGRKLFWLCVAAVGFAAGVELAPHIVQQPSSVLQLTFAIVLGFVGALLALFLQKLAVGIVGFVAGGRLALALTAAFYVNHASYYWLILLIGGIVGAILLLSLFDWALIVVSSLIGAYLILRAITLPPTGSTILLIALTVLGVVAQTAMLRRGRAVVG